MNIEESESLDDPIPLSDPALDAAPEFGPVDTTEIPLVVVAIAQPPEPTSHEEFPVMEPISLEEIEPIPLADHASTPEIIDAVRLLGDRIDRRLTDLQASFDREVRAEVSREKVIDRRHSELQWLSFLSTPRRIRPDLSNSCWDSKKASRTFSTDKGLNRTATTASTSTPAANAPSPPSPPKTPRS